MPDPTGGSSYSTVALSGDSLVDALLGETKMGGPLGSGAVVSYSFPGATSGFTATTYWLESYGSGEPDGISYLDQTDRANVVQALQAWSSVANISFVETTDTNTNVGDLRFAYSIDGFTSSNTVAHAYSPGDGPEAGDVWFNANHSDTSSLALGTFGFQTALHEIGHALGLKHPFEGSYRLPDELENTKYTVMSYTDTADPVGPMVYDILAIQYLYGANWSFHAGDDNHLLGGGYGYTLWDAGGTDTITLATSGTLDLREGSLSTIGGKTFGIAFYAQIENAVGSGFNDLIWGNWLANDLRGAAGNDNLNGLEGNDVLNGGQGNDRLDGGSGADTLNGGLGDDSYVVDSLADVIAPDAGGADYVYSSVNWTLADGLEFLYLNDGASIGVGNAGVNLLYANASLPSLLMGLDGPDHLWGSLLGDTLVGGNGLDIFAGGPAPDRLEGGNGADTIRGDDGRDTIYGGDGNDLAFGGNGLDLVFGGLGDDTLWGDAGDDTIYGGGGNDTVLGSEGNDSLDGGPGDDTLRGGAGNDALVASEPSDRLAGDAGADTYFAPWATNLALGSENFNPLSEPNSAWIGFDVHDGSAALPGLAFMSSITLLEGALDFMPYEDKFATYALLQLTGNEAANQLRGAMYAPTFASSDAFGPQYIFGLGGNDWIEGEWGANPYPTGQNPIYSQSLLDGFETKGHFDDVIGAGQGNDTVLAGPGRDWVLGGTGIDSLLGDGGADALEGGDDADTLRGGAGNDTLIGNTGPDWLLGEAGDDDLRGGKGHDVASGGDGNDLLRGALGNDLLAGGTGNDALLAGQADDVLQGGAGADTLFGGQGHDTLTGGAGADRFQFNTAGGANADVIADFAPGEDVIELDSALLVALAHAAGEPLPEADFGVHVLYNGLSGALSYDADGAGGAAPELIATLANHAALTADVIFVS